MLRVKNAVNKTGVCETLMPDLMAPEAHQNDPSYVTYSWFSSREFSMVGGYTEELEKPQKCQNWGVGTCAGMGDCPGQYNTGKYIRNVMWKLVCDNGYHI